MIKDSQSEFVQKVIDTNPSTHHSKTSLLSFGHIKPDDNQLLASVDGESADISLHLWNYDQSYLRPGRVDGAIWKTLSGHLGAVTVISVSGNGNLLVSGSMDRTIRVWTNPHLQNGDNYPSERTIDEMFTFLLPIE